MHLAYIHTCRYSPILTEKKINLINLEILQCLRPKEVAVQGEDVQPWKTEQGQHNFSFHNLLDPITTLWDPRTNTYRRSPLAKNLTL